MKTLTVIAGISLLIGMTSFLDYSYYQLLRVFVTIAAAIVAYKFYETKLIHFAFIFGGVAFLFNPVIPVYLDKGTWVILDFICAILFFVAAASYKNNGRK